MKQRIKIPQFVLALFLIISCQSNAWYLGEWTNGKDSFTLTQTALIDSDGEVRCLVKFYPTENGGTVVGIIDPITKEEVGVGFGGSVLGYSIDLDEKNQEIVLTEAWHGYWEERYHKVKGKSKESSTKYSHKSEEESLDEGYGDLAEVDDVYDDGIGDVIGDFDEMSMDENEAEIPIEEMGFDKEDISKNLILVIDKDDFEEIPSSTIDYFKEDCGISVEQWKKRGYQTFKPLKIEENGRFVVLHYTWVTNPDYSWSQSDILTIMKKVCKVSLPEGMKSAYIPLGDDKSNLRCVTLPNTITFIPGSTFKDCVSLSYISLPNSLEYIEEEAFWKCYNLVHIALPESLIKIGRSAFYKSGLQSVEIPSSLTEIDGEAFRDCASLREILIPSSSNLKRIGGGAFRGCGIAQITLPSHIQEIEGATFYGCNNLEHVSLPGVNRIGTAAFAECPRLTDINIPESVTEIDDEAFASCSRLQTVVIPKGVKNIRKRTFRNCVSLSSIVIPNTVTAVGESAFEGCYSLSKLTLPNSVETIDNMAFRGSGLTHFDIPESILYFAIRYGDGSTSRGRKNDVSIRLGLFAECRNLESVTIPEGVAEISESVFEGCTSLKSITLPNSIKRIGKKAFKGSGLTQITLPESVAFLETELFFNCYNLRKVVLSERLRNDVREYGNKVFPSGVEISYY